MECVPLSKFLEALSERNAGFDSKVAMLLSNQYKCFQKEKERDKDREGKESKRDTSNGRWSKTANAAPIRPAMITRTQQVQTPEAIARKAFLPLMNKLTDKNKQAIFAQVVKLSPSILIQTFIVWDTCLGSPTYQSVYMELLDILMSKVDDGRDLVSKYLNEKVTTYFQTSAFLPPDTIEGADYDDFCDYVKWKKQSIATVTMLLLLENKGLIIAVAALTEKLLDSCDSLLTQKEFEKADVVLDQIYQIYIKNTARTNIAPFIQKWLPHTDVMKPSTRFKFYTFAEATEKHGNNNSNKWVSASVAAISRPIRRT